MYGTGIGFSFRQLPGTRAVGHRLSLALGSWISALGFWVLRLWALASTDAQATPSIVEVESGCWELALPSRILRARRSRLASTWTAGDGTRRRPRHAEAPRPPRSPARRPHGTWPDEPSPGKLRTHRAHQPIVPAGPARQSRCAGSSKYPCCWYTRRISSMTRASSYAKPTISRRNAVRSPS